MQTRTLEIDGMQLALRGSGGHGPSVLLVHGSSSSSRSFTGLLEGALGRRYALWSLDLPGHGASDRSPRPGEHYTIAGLARLLPELVAQLADGPYALVGHSIGGHVLCHALPRLADAKALVLVSAPPLSMATLARAFKPDPVDGALFKGTLTTAQTERFAAALLGPAAASPAALEGLCAAIRATDPAFRATLGASIMAGELHDERANVAGTAVPVALVWGTDDAFIEPACYEPIEAAQWLGRGRYPRAGSGHSPHLDQPGPFEGLLAELLATAFGAARR